MVTSYPTNSAITDYRAGNLQADRDKGNGIYGNAIGKKVSLEKTAQTRVVSGAVNAIYGNAIGDKKKAWYEGVCEYCDANFKKKTTWQRFCCTEHQALAYELRTGKKWYSKSKAK